MSEEKIKVLFVDDEKSWWELLEDGLQPYGIDIFFESDADRTLARIRKDKPELLLLDIKFKVSGGYENKGKPTLKKVRSKYQDLPVIMITTTMGDVEYQHKDYEDADGWYPKELFTSASEKGYERLANLIRDLVSKRQSQAETIEGPTVFKGIDFGFVVGSSPKMKNLCKEMLDLIDKSANVLIQGETGTGKELIADCIQKLSDRANQPYCKIHCGSLAETLLESELFGHRKGAFTGADSDKQGFFEKAHDGTIFLDEITETSNNFQLKLLRVLQNKEIIRVGDTQPRRVDVRVISATNREIEKEVKESRFRQDLYYRLNVIPLHVPPLRERKEDISILFDYFVSKYGCEKNILTTLRPDVLDKLNEYEWPGNIREFENVIERAVIVCQTHMLMPEDIRLGKDKTEKTESSFSLIEEELVNKYVERLLKNEEGLGIGADCEDQIKELKFHRDIIMKVYKRLREKKGKKVNRAELAEILKIGDNPLGRKLNDLDLSMGVLEEMYLKAL